MTEPRFKVTTTARSNLGELLSLWRAAHHLTLRALAAQIGTSAATLLRIEQGKPTDVETFLKLWAWLLLRNEVSHD